MHRLQGFDSVQRRWLEAQLLQALETRLWAPRRGLPCASLSRLWLVMWRLSRSL